MPKSTEPDIQGLERSKRGLMDDFNEQAKRWAEAFNVPVQTIEKMVAEDWAEKQEASIRATRAACEHSSKWHMGMRCSKCGEAG